MRVLMVTPSYDPIVGGTETLVRKLAAELNAMGTCTNVMTFNMNDKWNPVWREDIEEGEFKVFRIPAFNPFSFLRINPLNRLLKVNVIPKANFTKRFEDYDIIHFFDEVDLSFPLFSIFPQKPKIMHCVTAPAFGYESFRRNYFQRKIFTRIADLYIDSTIRRSKLLLGLGIPASKILTLPIGVDTETFRPDRTKKLDRLILFVGRLQKIKGVHILLQSLSFLKIQTQTVIIGPIDQNDPQYTEKIKQMRHSINEKGVHKVKYLGSLDENGLVPWYQRATILVRPDLEGISGGLITLEALACGTPVIGTGNHVIKDGVNGILVPPNDPKKLANALKILLENKELREKYGKEGRKIVELHFSLDHMAKKLTEIYEKLLTKYNKAIEASRRF